MPQDILITPNRALTSTDASITFRDASDNIINLRVINPGTLSFDGSSGQLFSITDDLTGTIFSVNDISGIPSIEVNADGTVSIAEFSGNVGIGTSSPTEKLEVSGNVKATSFVGALSGNATTATNLSTNRTNWATNGTISAVVGELSWKNYSNNHTIFDASAGTSPNGGAVNNTNSQVAWTGTYPTLMGWNGSNTYGVRVDSARVSDNTSGNAATVTNGVYTTGNQSIAGIKTFSNLIATNPMINSASSSNDASVMQWRYDTSDAYRLRLKQTVTSGVVRWNFSQTNNNTNFEDVLVLDRGNVGVGTSSPSSKLEVSGELKATTITETSSIALKQNIEPLKSGLEKILQLTPVSYERKSNNKNEIGLIAEDVAEVMPELVSFDEEGKPVGIHYSKLSVLLIQALKELLNG
jgi:hypothetical protein